MSDITIANPSLLISYATKIIDLKDLTTEPEKGLWTLISESGPLRHLILTCDPKYTKRRQVDIWAERCLDLKNKYKLQIGQDNLEELEKEQQAFQEAVTEITEQKETYLRLKKNLQEIQDKIEITNQDSLYKAYLYLTEKVTEEMGTIFLVADNLKSSLKFINERISEQPNRTPELGEYIFRALSVNEELALHTEHLDRINNHITEIDAMRQKLTRRLNSLKKSDPKFENIESQIKRLHKESKQKREIWHKEYFRFTGLEAAMSRLEARITALSNSKLKTILN